MNNRRTEIYTEYIVNGKLEKIQKRIIYTTDYKTNVIREHTCYEKSERVGITRTRCMNTLKKRFESVKNNILFIKQKTKKQ
jgi:hypothetical protein